MDIRIPLRFHPLPNHERRNTRLAQTHAAMLPVEFTPVPSIHRNTHINAYQLRSNLAPGGYAEFIEYDSIYTSPDGSLKADSDLAVFNRMFLKAIEDNNIDPSPGPKLEEMMQTAGFVDVTVAKHAMPFGTWPEDRHLVRIPFFFFF